MSSLLRASMNPARSLAPALFSGVLTHLWLYWSATFIGTSIVALLVRNKFTSDNMKQIPRNDIERRWHLIVVPKILFLCVTKDSRYPWLDYLRQSMSTQSSELHNNEIYNNTVSKSGSGRFGWKFNHVLIYDWQPKNSFLGDLAASFATVITDWKRYCYR